jgi:ABC-type transport system substrate-binding protein
MPVRQSARFDHHVTVRYTHSLMKGLRMTRRSLWSSIESMRPQDAAFFRSQFSRRRMLAGATAMTTAAMLPGTTFARQDADAPEAAAPEEQVFRTLGSNTTSKVMDFYESVYEEAPFSDLFSLPLVRLDREFSLIPGGATEWTSNEEGTLWTFTLQQGLDWSDGNPVTANDYIRTFQYAADPEHAWDFAWFWSDNIVNFTEAVAGDVALDEIGVRQGKDEYELIVETIDPAPYLPAKLIYSPPLSAAALDTHGPYYNNNPETCVSSGPFKLEEWRPDDRIILVRNEAYTGDLEVPLQRLIGKLADPSTAFTLYESGEVDYIEGLAPAEIQIAESDSEMADQIYQGVGPFRSDYFAFDVTVAPWDDLRVRQAFSHVLDRDALQQQVWGRQAKACASFLAPGFPASNTDALADIQAFDPERAKSLLAEAGYPDGEGFPALVLQTVTGRGAIYDATAEAYGSMLNEHLGIEVEIQTIDSQAYYAAMNAKPTEIAFGFISYGMDYFDASNMLGVWVSGGRHSWSNPKYDELVDQASSFTGDPAEREALFQDAERILVEDVPAVFAYVETPIQLAKPYVAGSAFEPDSNGIAAIHWPGFKLMSTVFEELYIAADAPTGRE